MGINVISCAIMGITDQLFHEDRDGFVIFSMGNPLPGESIGKFCFFSFEEFLKQVQA